MPKVTWNPEAMQSFWSPPSLFLDSIPGPLLWVELALRVPMQGSSLHHPGSKRLREAAEVRAWDSYQTRNYGEWPSLTSTQYYQWLSAPLPPGALESPESEHTGR